MNRNSSSTSSDEELIEERTQTRKNRAAASTKAFQTNNSIRERTETKVAIHHAASSSYGSTEMEVETSEPSPEPRESSPEQPSLNISFDAYDSSSTSSEEENIYIDNPKLFTNSQLTVSEFNQLFIACANRLSLAESHCQILLAFIRLIAPTENHVPSTYNRIKKTCAGNNDFMQRWKLCSICFKELNQLKKCPSKELNYHNH